jgi:hypothetical protein
MAVLYNNRSWTTGAVCFTMMVMDTDTHVIDHLAIAKACTAMGWYADRHQWDQLEALFAEEVLVDYTSLNGGDPVWSARTDLVAGWRGTLGGLAATQHMMANPLVTITEDAATCLANFQATHLGSVGGTEVIWTLGGHYRFALARQSDGWRITEIMMSLVWETGTRDVLAGQEG